MERPDSEFKAIHASVRPARVAILVEKDDGNWQDTCLRIIEFYSRLWGGAYNLIIPTDGKTIDERFWTFLETFDPDYVYRYLKSGEDVYLSRPEQYEQTLHAQVAGWLSQVQSADPESARSEIDKHLRRSITSPFTIDPELQSEIKTRLAPFYFGQWIVDAGAVTADQAPMFPLADLTKIILNTEHPDTVALVEEPTNQIPKIWFSAVCGRLSPSASQAFKEIGIAPKEFVFGPENHSQLVELTVTGAIRRPRVFSTEAIFHQLDGILPYQLSMLQLGLYRSVKYAGYNEPMLIVTGNTFEDFCLYYCLSRLRDRVVWMLPSITEKALAASSEGSSRVEVSFAAKLHSEAWNQQSRGGLACTTYSLGDGQLDAVIERLSSSGIVSFRSPVQVKKELDLQSFLRAPLVAYERDNFQRDISVQLSNGVSVGPFATPKPKNFHRIDPYEHRYITQLSIAGTGMPKHYDLGKSTIIGHSFTTKEVRVGQEGPAYFCPNVAYFGGDIDSVLVRPRLRLPALDAIVKAIARSQQYDCRPSDKGIYADESVSKWGGLPEMAAFLRDGPSRACLDHFLDTSKSELGQGVYLRDDQRRYLDFAALKSHVGDAATDLIDELASKQILYRGFIFACSYCRNSSWYSVAEIGQEFRCRRCGRSQIYTKPNWKMPEEPAWFYKLDELVYQGYRHGMAVSLLALDYLRVNSSETFSFATDREFWEEGRSKAEIDFFCVPDGVLTIGEAKKEGRLGSSVSEENAEINKYLRVARSLSARQVVFATMSEVWSDHTVTRVVAAFGDTKWVRVRFLNRKQLFDPKSG